MNKRGEAEEMETLTLFDVILGILVASFLILSIFTFTGMSSFGKEYVEKDISALMSAILASPGEITVKYPISPDYRIQMQNPETGKADKIKVLHEPTLSGAIKKDIIVFTSGMENGLSIVRQVPE